MLKQGICVFIVLLCALMSHAQSEIFISDQQKNISKVDIVAGNCTKTVIVNTGINLSDITLHPDGNMYGCSFTSRKVYRVNMTTGALTELTTITEASRLVGMTADANGLIYLTEGNVTPSRLFVYDPVANTYTNQGFLDDGSAGDLTWYFGNLYNASDNNKLVKVDVNTPANSVVIGNFSGLVKPGDRMFALVSVIEDCDNSITYGLSEKGDYYRIDMATAIVDRLCIDNVDLFGATSADEFNASECFITLDLDLNDNSGASGSDFETDFSCVPPTAPIADVDVEINVANLVDSLHISFESGVLNGTSEFFTTQVTPNITSNNNSSFISAINTGTANTANFEQFLSNMLYNNTAASPSTGDRVIRVIGFSEGRSDTAFTTISFDGSADAGTDGSTSFCSSDPARDLFAQIGGMPDAGGNWSPALTSGTGVFNPSLDAAGTYYYIVTSGCFTDSAEVVVSIANSGSLNLGNDTTLCFATSYIINADQGNPSATYLWNTGSTDSAITVTTSGNYSVTIDLGSCQLQDDINVTLIDFDVDLGIDLSICPGDSVLIGDVLSLAGVSYNWSTGENIPEIYVNTPGTYTLTAQVAGCLNFDAINISQAMTTNLPVDLGPDRTICDGDNTNLSSGYNTNSFVHMWSNNAVTSDINVGPGTYYVNVYNACQDGNDTITIFSENCDTITDTTTVIDICEVKMPNAFTPNGDGVNDLFGPVNFCDDLLSYEFNVYNRYGQLVYSGENSFWDGSYKGINAPLDNFVWYATFTFEGDRIENLSGNIVVLR